MKNPSFLYMKMMGNLLYITLGSVWRGILSWQICSCLKADSYKANVFLKFSQTVGNAYGNFSLATMFPRREFTKEDYGKKLLELELAPSASVVLLPVGVGFWFVLLLFPCKQQCCSGISAVGWP